jgi:hypothetical protein
MFEERMELGEVLVDGGCFTRPRANCAYKLSAHTREVRVCRYPRECQQCGHAPKQLGLIQDALGIRAGLIHLTTPGSCLMRYDGGVITVVARAV